MQIRNVQLQNIGPHRTLNVDFGSGLIGLTGSNGAGKSTLVNAIYAALTNDFSRFNATKAEIITNGSGTEPSFIRLTGEHRGQEFTLTRWLRPSKNEFEIGGRSFTKANDVNDAVMAELNISKSVIDKYVFVDQWQMFGFLDQTDSERAKTFQYLCGTESASQIYKVCNDYVTKQKGTEIVDNSLELQEAIDEARKSMTDWQQEIAQLKPFALDDATANELRQVLARAAAAEEAEAELGIKAELHDPCQDKLTAAVTALQEVQIEKRETEDWLAENADKEKRAHDRVRQWQAEQKTQAQRAQWEKTLAETQEFLAQCDWPKLPEAYCPAEQREALKQERDRYKALLQATQGLQLDDPVCAYCGQEISEKHREKLQTQQDGNLDAYNAIMLRLSRSQAYDERMVRRKQQIDALESKIRELEARLETLPAIGTQSSAQGAEAFLQRVASKRELLEQLREKVVRLEKLRTRAESELQVLEQRITHLRNQISKKPTDDEFAEAHERLTADRDAVPRIAEASGAYHEAERTAKRAQLTLDQLKARLAGRVKIRNLLDTISAVGDVFHWNNLPKMVSQANLELLVGDINANLELFNNPFTVEADEDLTFRVYFPGQRPVKAKQLSGGQKVILAIAFRAALGRVFGHDVGMLFLDEPTSGLDADNVSYFHEALQQLSQKLGANRQLVVITHVHELSEVFDQLVEIKKNGT